MFRTIFIEWGLESVLVDNLVITTNRISQEILFVCFKNKFTFYDKSGRLDNSKCVRLECLKHGTSDNSRTVGWFSFRRNTTSGMSLREKFVHHGLRDLFSPVVDTFLHLLLVETTSIQLVLEQLSMSVSKQTNKQTNKQTTILHSH